MSSLFFLLAFMLVALFVYLGRYSGRVAAEAERFIAAPPEAVRAEVADLARWQAWNPWLEHARDPRAATADGDQLAWDVPQVGRARVTALKPPAPGALRQRMAFALPFAFKGRSDWRFEPVPGGTRVSWRFKGRVAFTLRAFAATVQGATALDLRFGLDRLAAVLEATPPAYRLDYAGVQALPAGLCVQQPLRAGLDALATELPAQIAGMRERLRAAGLAADGPAVVHYLRTQLKRRTVDGRVGVELPAGAPAPALPEGFAVHEQPAQSAYLLRFDGPPEALELAWYQAMQRLRVEQREPHPQRPPFARYLADPAPGRAGPVELLLPLKPA